MLVAPSILSADWTRLDEAVRLAEQGADWLHCDVMDGHFVPNLTFGPTMVEALHRMTRLPLDVHLMIEDPLRSVADYARAGANVLTLHLEASGVAGPGWPRDTPPSVDQALLRTALARTRATGVEVGLALRPDSPLELVAPILGELDLLLVMTVYPGFSGQAFLEGPLETMRQAAQLKRAHGYRFRIEVDGGIEARTTGPLVAQAGAEIVVAGHGVYRQPDPVLAIKALKALASDPAHQH